LIVIDPQYLPDKQFFQVFTAVRVFSQHQDPGGRSKYEARTYQGFLNFRPAFIRPVQDVSRDQCGGHRGNLHHEAFRFPPHRVCGDYAEPGDLCDCKINENDSTPQYLRAQRHVRTQD
jgi:hypothetical protein